MNHQDLDCFQSKIPGGIFYVCEHEKGVFRRHNHYQGHYYS